jgi:AmmeMemoRadiSam system protein B
LWNGAGEGIKRLILIIVCGGFSLLRCLSANPVSVDTYYPGDALMWDYIMASGPPIEFPGRPRGVILPHHAITGTEVARFYRGLSRVITPETVVIIGPNHFERGTHNIQTTDSCVYDTVYGSLEIDTGLVQRLTQGGVVHICNAAFPGEHAIFFHAPFIKKFFPRAKIVPVIIHWDATVEELDSLVRELSALMPPDALVLASVDFSHYCPRQSADFHDITSLDTITNFDYGGLFNLEIDSPPSIYVLEKLMAGFGCRNAVRLLHTNSDDFKRISEVKTTSHQYFAFFPGDPVYREQLTIFAAGDIRVNNDGLYIRTAWPWDRAYDPAKDTSVTAYLRNLRGKEDRFLMGYDLYIFDMRETGRVFSFAKNGLKVQVIKLREHEQEPGRNAAEIRQLAAVGDCLIVIFKYNGGLVTPERKQEARALIDAGADIVLGRGLESNTDEPAEATAGSSDSPEAAGRVEKEYYKNKLIVYSQGDIIAAAPKSSGAVLQILLTREKVECRELPLIIRNGYPELAGF